MRGVKGIVANKQFLVEFFARAQAGELDGDVGIRVLHVTYCQARQRHHAPCQVHDADGLAHVEQEQVAAFGHGASLQHQLRGFRDGHEVAGHFRVRDRYRATSGDLTPEQRDHAAT
ncbi:MAG: hypothetical protein ACD_23C00573G0001 [uncultured bacterium]|nr:MAG: hypothetical protein ACD_23C00573G0001 [uncultured bacterium]